MTRYNTPFTTSSLLYSSLVRHATAAGIEIERPGVNRSEHVDLHSLRRTFATNLIINGADPKTVMELMGHSSLRMTLGVYTKVQVGAKRAAVGRLTYGAGASAPEHVVEFRNPEQPGHKMSTAADRGAMAAS